LTKTKAKAKAKAKKKATTAARRKPERRCTECGAVQHETRQTVMYPESGLDNVQLVNVPVWVCENGHEELEIPAITQLHDLLTHVIIRKPARLTGREIRFIRRRAELSAQEFACRIGISPQHLSRLENDKGKKTRTLDLLIRLGIATLIAARHGQPLPDDLAPLVDQLEAAFDVGTHRLKHLDQALPEHQWEQTSV